MSKYKRLFTDILIFALGTLGSKLILFFLVPLYTRVLTTDQYGVAELAFTIGQLLTPVLSLTIYDALFRFGFMKEYKKEDVLNTTFRVFLFGSILTIVSTPLLGFYPAIAPYKWYICAYVIVSFSSQIGLLYLKIKSKNKTYSVMCILQAGFLVLCNILFLLILKIGISGYLLSTIISLLLISIISFFLGGVFSDLRQSEYSKKLTKRMLKYSIPLIFGNLSWWLIHSSDKIMLQLMIDESSVGLYSAAAKIPSILNIVGTIFSQAWTISSIHEYDSTNDKLFYSSVFRYYNVSLFGVCLLIILIIKPFMSVYVGNDYFSSWIFVPALLIAACLTGISTFMGTFYAVTTKSKNSMLTTMIAAIINIVTNYIFIQIVGVWGAIIGTIAAYLVICIIRMIDIHKIIGFDYHLINLVANLGITATLTISLLLGFNIYKMSLIAICIFVIVNFKTIKLLSEKALAFINNLLKGRKNA